MSSGGPPPLPLIAYPAWLLDPERKPEGDSDGGASPPAGDAPGPAPTYTLPPELKAGLQSAWDGSICWGERSRERGGILVRKVDGSLEWRPVKIGKKRKRGDGRSIRINYGDVGKDETLVASAHTHPFTKVEGGHTRVSFSDGDLANLVTGPEPQKFVRSNDTVFRVAKTPEFEAIVKEARDRRREDELKAEIKATWQGAYQDAKGSLPERTEAAVRAVCRKYRLTYFKGTGDTLQRVDTSR